MQRTLEFTAVHLEREISESLLLHCRHFYFIFTSRAIYLIHGSAHYIPRCCCCCHFFFIRQSGGGIKIIMMDTHLPFHVVVSIFPKKLVSLFIYPSRSSRLAVAVASRGYFTTVSPWMTVAVIGRGRASPGAPPPCASSSSSWKTDHRKTIITQRSFYVINLIGYCRRVYCCCFD